jgi:N4-gp56 family major capsid protein
MARTTISTTDALRKESWEELLFRDTMKQCFFTTALGGDALTKLEKGEDFGSTPNDVLYIKTDMGAKGKTKTRNGDKVTFGLVPRLDPATYSGVTSGQTLKGKEVPLTTYYQTLELERYRQAVSAGAPMDWARASFDMPAEARTALMNWGAEKIDELCFDALDASPTKILYLTSGTITGTTTEATAKAGVTASDKLTPAMVSAMRAYAKTGGGRTGSIWPIRPVKIKGREYYVLLVYPDVLYDWKQNATVQQAYREAMDRGGDNPLFQSASYIWDDVIIYESERITVGTDGGGSTVPYAKCHFIGAQALQIAFGERPSIIEDSEDYEEDWFYAWRMTMKAQKTKFNSYDYGDLCIYIARTNIAGL